MVAPALAWRGVKLDRGGGAAGGGEWESGQVSPISLARATRTPSLPDMGCPALQRLAMVRWDRLSADPKACEGVRHRSSRRGSE